jgi:hypothetical protein
MLARLAICVLLALLVTTVFGEEQLENTVEEPAEVANEQTEAMGEQGDKLISGMSIVGNHEAPKSLVIVPWKSSELGNGLEVARMLDDGRGPVDKDVFMRELDYYEIRSQGNP